MDGPSAPPGALLPAREHGLPQCRQHPSLRRQEAPGQAQPESLGPQTPMAIFLNSAGQGHRWESPDKQPSVAHSTIMTINWEPDHTTKSWSQAKCTLAVGEHAAWPPSAFPC